MIQEDKELLLKDLCARLPHKCRVFYEYIDDLDNKTYGYSLTLNTWCIDEFIANKAVIKPYLRPMSSMTEEESKQFLDYIGLDSGISSIEDGYIRIIELGIIDLDLPYKAVDWLNAHHFDYRGLIPKGLAIEVTEENNPYEEAKIL